MRSTGFSFIAPLLVLMVVAFNLPILYMLGLAFWEKGRGFTLEHYEGLVEAPVYLRVLGNTMRIALIATHRQRRRSAIRWRTGCAACRTARG